MAEENLGLDLASQTGQEDIVEAINGLKNLLSRLPDLLTLGSKTVTQNGTYDPNDDSLDGYSSLVVNVPNTYAASDEGKVLSNGELVAQSSQTVTKNGTYDTTLINSITVDIPQQSTSTQYVAYKVWTKSTGGYDASLNVQKGICTVTDLADEFEATGSVTNILYTSVQNNAKNIDDIFSISYSSSWKANALSNVVVDRQNYSNGDLVKTWTYDTNVTFYIIIPE